MWSYGDGVLKLLYIVVSYGTFWCIMVYSIVLHCILVYSGVLYCIIWYYGVLWSSNSQTLKNLKL